MSEAQAIQLAVSAISFVIGLIGNIPQSARRDAVLTALDASLAAVRKVNDELLVLKHASRGDEPTVETPLPTKPAR